MPFTPVRAFWVEPTGRLRVGITRKGQDRETLTDVDSEEAWKALTDPLWAAGELESSCAQTIYRLPDGREVTSSELPIGSMYDADYLHDSYPMPDGVCLAVVVPDGHWIVDSRASNCTLPDDREHRCWRRHGNPRCEPVHVDKDGCTCGAGAGSIQMRSWHGFLDHGWITETRGVHG